MHSIKLTLFALLAAFALNTNVEHANAEGKVLRAATALDKDTKPTDTFTTDAPKLYTFYIGEALKEGDKIKGVWIAEDVGAIAPKDTKIDEATIAAKTATDQGAFSLSRPTAGWPLGDYRVEIFVNDKLAETVKFKIKQGQAPSPSTAGSTAPVATPSISGAPAGTGAGTGAAATGAATAGTAAAPVATGTKPATPAAVKPTEKTEATYKPVEKGEDADEEEDGKDE